VRITKVTDWKSAGWKIISLIVSAKVQIWIVATLLLIFSLIGAAEWLTVTIIVLGGRIAKAYAEKQAVQNIEEGEDCSA
jgi:hypothetical protein